MKKASPQHSAKKKKRLDRPRQSGLAMFLKQLPDDTTSDRFLVSEECAFLAATLAWRYGLAANAIMRVFRWKTSANALMRMKSTLRYAQDRYFRLIPPEHVVLEERLSRCVNQEEPAAPAPHRAVRFHVVNDLALNLVPKLESPPHGPAIRLPFGPVFERAAQVAAELIADVARRGLKTARAKSRQPAPALDARPQPNAIIVNAGGGTIAEIVRILQRHPPMLDPSQEESHELRKQLHFVAANAAYLPDKFQHSANYLAVRLSEVYATEHHFALTRFDVEDLKQKHRDLVARAGLLICGAGAISQSLLRELLKLRGKEWMPPDEAVGDLGFNLLDQHGYEVPIHDPIIAPFLEQLNPSLKPAQFHEIAAKGRVLLVLDGNDPLGKTDIAIAALRRRYPTDVVLGARLAFAILEKWPEKM